MGVTIFGFLRRKSSGASSKECQISVPSLMKEITVPGPKRAIPVTASVEESGWWHRLVEQRVDCSDAAFRCSLAPGGEREGAPAGGARPVPGCSPAFLSRQGIYRVGGADWPQSMNVRKLEQRGKIQEIAQ
jgi:hypothetical protein